MINIHLLRKICEITSGKRWVLNRRKGEGVAREIKQRREQRCMERQSAQESTREQLNDE